MNCFKKKISKIIHQNFIKYSIYLRPENIIKAEKKNLIDFFRRHQNYFKILL